MRVPDGRIFDLGEADPRAVRPAAVDGTGAGATVGHANGDLKIFINYRREDTSGHALLLTDIVGHVELLAASLSDYVNTLRSTLTDLRGEH